MKKTPMEKAFLKSVSKMPDHLQKGILVSMQTFNSLPLEQQSREIFRRILIFNGFSSQVIYETFGAGIEFEAGIEIEMESNMQIDPTELSAAITQLRTTIAAIVSRHRIAGDPLTWRLLHAIEAEAFQEIARIRNLNPVYVSMLQSSPFIPYSKNDELVDLGDSNALPPAFSLIWDAYKIAH